MVIFHSYVSLPEGVKYIASGWIMIIHQPENSWNKYMLNMCPLTNHHSSDITAIVSYNNYTHSYTHQ